MKKIIILVIVLALVLGIGFYFVSTRFLSQQQAPSDENITLTVYSLWENAELVKPVIEQYQAQRPNVKIDYRYQSSINYRSRVQAQIDAGQGPDIFLIHNTWLPIFTRGNYLAPIPSAVMSESDYDKIFYPVAKESFSKDGKIYAMPLEIDGISLFINEDMFAEAGVQPPTDWLTFTDTAVKLTKKDETGRITQAGAAIGATGNVDHWSDLIGLLFKQQAGADLEHPANQSGADVLRFYTNFVLDPNRKVWDMSLPPSTQSFASGRVAMYFGPSWRAHEIRLANPQLKFKTVPVPQLSRKTVGWATYWAYAVSAKSAHPDVAWEFVEYLTSAEVEKSLYQTASNARLFGQPYSRIDLGPELRDDPLVGSFVNQGPSYTYWYLASNTFDQDLNDKMIKYYEDALNATLGGADPLNALTTTEKGVQQVLNDLKNAAASPSP